MFWTLLGCIAAVLLILAWWHRVLLTLWCILATMWTVNQVVHRLIPLRWERRLVNGPLFKMWMAQLRYACEQQEKGIGGHCFEEDDE